MLRHAQYNAGLADVGVYLTGLAALGRAASRMAAEVLASFDGFRTPEDALTASLN